MKIRAAVLSDMGATTTPRRQQVVRPLDPIVLRAKAPADTPISLEAALGDGTVSIV